MNVERILLREEEKEQEHVVGHREKLKIGIIGISSGAGASFMAMSLAKALSKMKKGGVAVVELGDASIYDSMGMDKRFAGRTFFSFYNAVNKGESIRGKTNMDEGINWILRVPHETDIAYNLAYKLRLIDNAVGDFILCDFSGEPIPVSGESEEEGGNWKSTKLLLEDMDHLIIIVDPMPSKMMKGYKILVKLRSHEIQLPVTYVINKYNGGVNKKEMTEFLRIRRFMPIPHVDPEDVYQAEYNCKSPYSIESAQKKLAEPIEKLISIIDEKL
ncbi:MAG: hypothetical protein RR131_04205 [Anaerovorax sp.]